MNKGVKACEEAFRRLIEGEPHIASHIGLPKYKITAGTVSVEAGFDRGYLKKARLAHKPLIANIDAQRIQNLERGNSRAEELRRCKDRVVRAKRNEEVALCRLFKVLTHNLVLVERIRVLEDKLPKDQNVRKL
jgi:hypothetical protein